MIAKLHTYGFDRGSLKILWRYLNNCQQRTKISTTFSYCAEAIKGVLQKINVWTYFFQHILRLSIFLLEEAGICSYADDTTPGTYNLNLDQFINRTKCDVIFHQLAVSRVIIYI